MVEADPGATALMLWLSIAGAAFLIWLILVFLFAPDISYHLTRRLSIHDEAFLETVCSVCQSSVHDGNRVSILTNGSVFYPAMIQAIRGATRSVNLECYIFLPGPLTDQFVDALSERARNGVEVRIVMDAVGSFTFRHGPARELRKAGCRVERYRWFHWYSLARLNNRTHRELLVVDGRVAFTGGAGIADWWAFPARGGSGLRARSYAAVRKIWHRAPEPPWRDTMARIEGPVVTALQGVAAENWLECCGEILAGPAYFPSLDRAGQTTAFVVKSSPADRSTASRVAFQLFLEGADREIHISTPYFLPDRALRQALIAQARRGVAISVIVPGRHTDQRWVRLASRRMWGALLEAGIRFYEYRPAMTHVKMMVVDGLWATIGTTNIDNRSFEHNDEVNVAVRDEEVAARLLEDYQRDIMQSDLITLEAWRQRPRWEKIVGPFVWILERQQ